MPHVRRILAIAAALAASLTLAGRAGAQELAVGTIGASSDSPFFERLRPAMTGVTKQ